MSLLSGLYKFNCYFVKQMSLKKFKILKLYCVTFVNNYLKNIFNILFKNVKMVHFVATILYWYESTRFVSINGLLKRKMICIITTLWLVDQYLPLKIIIKMKWRVQKMTVLVIDQLLHIKSPYFSNYFQYYLKQTRT